MPEKENMIYGYGHGLLLSDCIRDFNPDPNRLLVVAGLGARVRSLGKPMRVSLVAVLDWSRLPLNEDDIGAVETRVSGLPKSESASTPSKELTLLKR